MLMLYVVVRKDILHDLKRKQVKTVSLKDPARVLLNSYF